MPPISRPVVKKALCALLSLLLLAGCAPMNAPREGVAITDAMGNTAQLAPDARVVCAYASFAQCWLAAGGVPVGVTADAVEERHLPVGDAAVVGTTKALDLEQVVALNPDYVLLSADLTAHTQLEESLRQMGLAYGYFRVDTFEDYKEMMAQLCAVTGREDLYQSNVLEVEENIAGIRERIPGNETRSALLLRAYSTGVKAKGDDILAGQILKEYGLRNPVDSSPSLLEELSMEAILREDPDCIFVVTMGDEAAAADYLTGRMASDPAWSGLRALREGRCYVLPQDLFHHKPNERWDESYAYLAKILYPELF
ncbi:MAG: ABC transporter substrate-binding protein [Clostridia bacterium]|nr:ABC transporter substrate-binding protein [Clostridia bacterium]